MSSKTLGFSTASDGYTHGAKYQKSSQEMGAYSDAGSQSCKKPRFSETNASSEMHLPVHSSNVGMRSNVQEPRLLFSKGKCTYGERCRYAHVIGNGRETEAEKGHWAVSRRSTGRMNLCQYFVGGRACPYGDKCRFLHEAGGNRANGGLGMCRKSSAICIVTSRGNNNGDKSKKFVGRTSNVPQVHQNGVWLKTRLCEKWEKMGSCWYGSYCHFAHGNAELQTVGYPNSLDSLRGYALDTTSKNAASWRPGFGIVHQQHEHCKGFLFKWTEVEKISQVYADWIDYVPLIPVSSGKVGN